MSLIFEKKSRPARYIDECDVPAVEIGFKRKSPLELPELSENDISRHYSELSEKVFGVNRGFYPLGSCTMKYNPEINEYAARLAGFTQIHPLAPASATAGCDRVLDMLSRSLCEICAMDEFNLTPAAGAHGELFGMLTMKNYFHGTRKKVIIPDTAHGTNPASAAMAGFEVVTLKSGSDGCVDTELLRSMADENTAGIMLTNPNTLGIFDRNIKEITDIIHSVGGLCYYDGANLNAIAGIARPGDMGFDIVHVNLHKTFSAPHGGGGPGSGPVGYKSALAEFVPERIKKFKGNFLVAVKALCYIMSLGGDGLRKASENAVLNANYLMKLLQETLDIPYDGHCAHEFVACPRGGSALDTAKLMIDARMHPPTIYFPLLVHEAMMFEPTETESAETIEKAAQEIIRAAQSARENPEYAKSAPHTTEISRPDEARAARSPILRA